MPPIMSFHSTEQILEQTDMHWINFNPFGCYTLLFIHVLAALVNVTSLHWVFMGVDNGTMSDPSWHKFNSRSAFSLEHFQILRTYMWAYFLYEFHPNVTGFVKLMKTTCCYLFFLTVSRIFTKLYFFLFMTSGWFFYFF